MEQFQDDRVELTVTESPGCVVQFEIHLLPKETAAAYVEAVKSIQKKASFPGFRKGKMPPAMVEKHFKDAIEEQWRDLVAQAAFKASAQLSTIYPWNMETVSPGEIRALSKEEGAQLSFRFEREPKLPTVDKEQLNLPALETVEPTDQDIERRLEDYRAHHGKFEPQADKKAAEGDYVRVDILSLEREPHPYLVKDGRLHIKQGEIPRWLHHSLQGMSAGESTDATTELDPEAAGEDKESFRPTRVRVIVTSVETLLAPEESELLKAMGASSMEELREKTRAWLVDQAKANAEEQRKQALWKQLLGSFAFEIPRSMLENERRRLVSLMVSKMRTERSEEEILSREREIEGTATREAESTLRRFFLARKIAQDAGKLPDEKEVISRAVRLMIHEGAPEPKNEVERKRLWQIYRGEAFYQLLVESAEQALL